MHIQVGQQYTYVPRDEVCTVLETFPDRHRCNIELASGPVVQEVGYQDLREAQATPPVEASPVPPSSPPDDDEESASTDLNEQRPQTRRWRG